METRFDLEDFVKNNLDAFNNEEPLKGHFDRFQSKLGKSSKIKPLIYRSMKYAAVVAFLIAGYFTLRTFDWFEKKEYQAEMVLSNDQEFNDAMRFYNMQLIQKQEELNKMTCKNTGNQKIKVNNDLSELKSAFAELTNDLKQNPDNQMIKNAMINNYQTQIEVYNLVIKNLQNYC